ncbi:hypothetical protein DIPPA_30615 [Diplonema papillatum]|nr:hypothetical protein DIPPA_30615 [Diplonema papillatum]
MDHHGSVSPPRRFGSPDQFGGAVDADPTYEPIIGGHNRSRGRRNCASVTGQSDAFFERSKRSTPTAPKRQTPSEGFL